MALVSAPLHRLTALRPGSFQTLKKKGRIYPESMCPVIRVWKTMTTWEVVKQRRSKIVCDADLCRQQAQAAAGKGRASRQALAGR